MESKATLEQYSKDRRMTLDQRKLRDIAGTFATGVTVLTTRDADGKPVGMTANSFTSLSLDPALVLITINKDASLYNTFMEADFFGINILSEHQEYLSRQFSRKNIDRFEGVSFETGVTGAPLLPETIGFFDCAVSNIYDGGDHTIIIGEVKDGDARDKNPLVFYKGRYTNIESLQLAEQFH